MRDGQANGLLELFGRVPRATLAVCGSEGAALTAQLAGALAELGQRVAVLDRSVGEVANACGVKARYDLAHVLEGDRTLEQVLLRLPDGTAVLPAARGLDRIAAEASDWQAALADAVPALATGFDVWLVHGLLPGATPGAQVVLALQPTASAVTAAYGQLKVLAQAQGRRDFAVVVHKAADAEAARDAFECIAGTARRFLAAHLDFLGYVPAPCLPQSAAARADGAVRQAVLALAQNLMHALRPHAARTALAS